MTKAFNIYEEHAMNKIFSHCNEHSYHMVLTTGLKNKIEGLSNVLGKSLSDTSVYIIDRTLNFFKKIHFTAEESPEFSNYPAVNWDAELRINFDRVVYRKIKHLADTHMSFSIALVVRWLFNYYFDNLYDLELKEEQTEEIEKINVEIEKLEHSVKKWDKKILNQQLVGKFHYYLTFNDKFSITGFNFLPTG